jgi:hypothetical protein
MGWGEKERGKDTGWQGTYLRCRWAVGRIETWELVPTGKTAIPNHPMSCGGVHWLLWRGPWADGVTLTWMGASAEKPTRLPINGRASTMRLAPPLPADTMCSTAKRDQINQWPTSQRRRVALGRWTGAVASTPPSGVGRIRWSGLSRATRSLLPART